MIWVGWQDERSVIMTPTSSINSMNLVTLYELHSKDALV